MIHSFSFDGLHLVLDGGSGSLHVVDAGALKAIGLYEEGHSLGEIARRMEGAVPRVDEFMEEFAGLIADNLLFAPPAPPPRTRGEGVVKALCLHVAHDCNLRCRYCFAGQGSFLGERALMPAETGFLAVDFLLERSGGRQNIEIDFLGGEPLLNFPAIRAITAYAEARARERGKRFKFTLTTNGLLLTGQRARYFKEKGFSVVLSLDGRPEIHDGMRPLIRGGGSFVRVYQNIRAFTRRFDSYTIRGTYTRENLDFTRDVAFLAEQGFKNISLEPVVGEEGRDFGLRLSDAPRLLREYEKLTRYYIKEKEAGRPFTFFHFLLDLEGGPCLEKRVKGCGAGTEYLAVTPEGHLYPCHQFVGEEAFKLGDLTAGEWHPSRAEAFADANVYTKEACTFCWARFYCGGGCHANNHKRRGSLRDVDELGCLLEKKRLECALYLKAREALGPAGVQPAAPGPS